MSVRNVGPGSWAAVGLVVLLVTAPHAALASGGNDGGREEEARYVGWPAEGGLAGGSGAGIGRVEFDVLEHESRVLFTIADDVFDRTQVTVVFRFGDAPIRHSVTFCRQHGMDVPNGATEVEVFLEPLFPFVEGEPNTCGSGHGATTGTVNARFA